MRLQISELILSVLGPRDWAMGNLIPYGLWRKRLDLCASILFCFEPLHIAVLLEYTYAKHLSNLKPHFFQWLLNIPALFRSARSLDRSSNLHPRPSKCATAFCALYLKSWTGNGSASLTVRKDFQNNLASHCHWRAEHTWRNFERVGGEANVLLRSEYLLNNLCSIRSR